MKHKLARIKTSFTRSPRRISVGLSGLKFLKATLSVYVVLLSAKYFGASLERDAWVLSGSVIFILTQLFFGPLNEIFRAKFVHTREEEGEEKAVKEASALSCGIVVVSFVLVLLVEVFPGVICNILAPGFTLKQKEVLSLMLRWMVPNLLAAEITLIWIAILNAYRSFFIPDAYSILSVIVNIICIIILAPVISIYSLIVASYIGSIFLSLFLIRALRSRNKKLIQIKVPTWPLIKPFIVFSAPFYFPYFFGQLHMAVEKLLCTLLGVGTVSILDYARKFIEIPMGMIFGVVTSVLTPVISGYFSKDKEADIYHEVIRFIRMLTFGVLLIAGVLFICSEDIVSLLLLHGEFKQEYVITTAMTLKWLSLGIIGAVFFITCGQAMIAQKNTGLFALASSFYLIISILINTLFYKVVGVEIFGISWSASLIITGIFLYFSFVKNKSKELNLELIKLLFIICLVISAGHVLRDLALKSVTHFGLEFYLSKMLIIAVIFILALCIEICCLFIFKYEERFLVISYFRKAINRG